MVSIFYTLFPHDCNYGNLHAAEGTCSQGPHTNASADIRACSQASPSSPDRAQTLGVQVLVPALASQPPAHHCPSLSLSLFCNTGLQPHLARFSGLSVLTGSTVSEEKKEHCAVTPTYGCLSIHRTSLEGATVNQQQRLLSPGRERRVQRRKEGFCECGAVCLEGNTEGPGTTSS